MGEVSKLTSRGHCHSLLSKPAILNQLGKGIVIHPFDENSLKSCSYDVRIGECFYRRKSSVDTEDPIFNPYSKEVVSEHFEGPFRAVQASTIGGFDPRLRHWSGVEPNDLVIALGPNELILGHTAEFVGGTKDPVSGRCFTAEMKARSSIGRIGFEICRCAGWGDVGYINRWTMEIKNDDPLPTFLVVGTRVAQMKFYEVDQVDREDLYGLNVNRDHYQGNYDLSEMISHWSPEMLLPTLGKT